MKTEKEGGKKGSGPLTRARTQNTMHFYVVESHLNVLCFSLGYATAKFSIVFVLFPTGLKKNKTKQNSNLNGVSN